MQMPENKDARSRDVRHCTAENTNHAWKFETKPTYETYNLQKIMKFLRSDPESEWTPGVLVKKFKISFELTRENMQNGTESRQQSWNMKFKVQIEPMKIKNISSWNYTINFIFSILINFNFKLEKFEILSS